MFVFNQKAPNPKSKIENPKSVYERLVREEYDNSPWTSEERHALAWEAGKHAGWEDMHEYDNEAQSP